METKPTKSVLMVSISTLLSRILGYFRDMLVANFFGVGMIADAFFVAYKIPNFLRNIIGEGAINASFVPVFGEYLEKKPQEAKDFIKSVSTIFFFVLLIFTILGIIFAPLLVRIIAPGFSGILEKFNLTVNLTRQILPFTLMIGLAALALAILNTLHIFTIPALAPCVLSIVEIIFIIFVCPRLSMPVYGLVWGVVFGGMAQFLFQVPILIKRGFNIFSLKIKNFFANFRHPGVKRIGYLLLPVIIGNSISQINAFVDTICASFLREGSVSALYYSFRLIQLPLALFPIAVVTVSLPLMSRAVSRGEKEEIKKSFSNGLKLVFFPIVPSIIGLIFLGKPIISLLFERGEFSAQATNLTYFVLFFYSLGLVSFSGARIATASFYAQQDTRTPVKIATIAMIMNIVLNIILMRFLEAGGLALATTIASTFNFCYLVYILRKKLGPLGGREILKSFLKILFASLIMGVCGWFIAYWWLIDYGKIIQVVGTIVFCILIYFLATYFLKCEELKSLIKIIK